MDFTPMKDAVSIVFGVGMIAFITALVLNWINKRL